MGRTIGCMLWVCLLLLGAAGARASDTAVAAPARATLERAIAALPAGWSARYAALAQDAGGALILKDLVLSHDGTLLLAVASLTLTGLHGDGSAAAPFAADRLEATHLGDAGKEDETVADRLLATGIAIGPGTADGLPAGSRAALIVQALTALRVDHAEIAQVHDKGGAIGRITLDHLAQGQVAAASIGDAGSDDPAQSLKVSIAVIEANDIDIRRLVRVFEPSAYAASHDGTDAVRLPVGPAVGRFAVHGLAIKKGGDATSVDAIELTDLRLGQAPAAPAGKTWGTVPASLGAAVVGSVRYQPQGAAEAAFEIASIALTNYSDGRFDTLRFGATRFTSADKHISFGLQAAMVRGFDAGLLLGWAAAGGADATGAADSTPPPPRLGGFALDGILVDTPAGDRVTLASLSDTLTYDGETPISQDLRIQGLVVPTHALADTVPPPVLAAFGRDSVTADLDFNLVWNPRTHDLTLAPFQISAADLGRLTLTLTLGNVDLSLLPRGAGPALAGLAIATIKDGELVYADASLLERGMAAYAAAMGQTAPELRQAVLTQLGNLKSPLPSRPLLPSQLAAFVEHPGTLSVRITPPSPLPAAMLAAQPPDETARKLALIVTVK